MGELINKLTEFIGQFGVLSGFLLVFLESIIPILPLSVFVAINIFTYGNVIGFIVLYFGNVTGSICAYFLCKKFNDYFEKKYKGNKKVRELKRLCGKRINDLCTRAFYLEKLKFLHWHKIVQQQKFDKASRLIQKNYHIYLNNKKKNKNKIKNKHDNKIKKKNENNINNKYYDNENIIKEEDVEQNSEE